MNIFTVFISYCVLRVIELSNVLVVFAVFTVLAAVLVAVLAEVKF